jgi:phosphoglycerate dehydrogenase-like enzyme
MTKQVLLDVPIYQPAADLLKSIPGVRLVFADPVSEQRRPLPADMLRETNVAFCSVLPANFQDCAALEWVQICSSGFEHLLEHNLPKRGIRASNAQGVFDIPIAEWCVASMINLTRDLRGMIRNQEQGVWDRDARFQREIRGKVVGFWGYGGLARETARLCKTMGIKVHVLTRHGVQPRPNAYCVSGTGDPEGTLPDACFTMERKEEFLRGLDFLVLALPLSPATRGMVGEHELRALPSTAFLLNPARGPLIQEPVLIRALQEGWFAGAALDTHFYYPMPAEHPIWRMPNVIMTPHISGSSRSPFFLPRVWDLFAQNLQRFVAGQPLLNELTQEQLAC